MLVLGLVTRKLSFGEFSLDKYPNGAVDWGTDVVYVFSLGYGESWLSTASILLSGLHKSILSVLNELEDVEIL